MNVFVLSTGRCGTVSFAKACEHITNYTVGHETRIKLAGPARLDYPDDHIEVDNRLCCFLGRLDKEYGINAYYVHLERNKKDVIASYLAKGMTNAGSERRHVMSYATHLLPVDAREYLLKDFIETRTADIEMFLKDKPFHLHVSLESIQKDFDTFWTAINAVGNFGEAIKVFDVRHNATEKCA